jgi:hypothetical protein
METNTLNAKFALGRTVATPGALEALAANGQTPAEFLDRHVRGDWGQVCAGDGQLNDEAILNGDRILSAYILANRERLWIITEADRSSTCVLLPSEY